MSDLRGMGGAAEEDRLPWLEPVDEELPEEGISAGRLIAGLVVALIALGLIVGGVYWLKQKASGGSAPAGSGDTTLIAAQPGPIKVKPAEPGGMQVKGQGDSSYAASEGADPNAKIDLNAVPEAPIAKDRPAAPAAAPAPAPTAPAKPAPAPVEVAKAPAPAAKAPAPAPAKPAPAPAKAAPAPVETASSGGGSQVQLGAFGSEAKANEAWKSLSGRFSYLGSLNKSVVAATVNGKTVYRLRASAGGQASSICSKLKVAGEACAVIG